MCLCVLKVLWCQTRPNCEKIWLFGSSVPSTSWEIVIFEHSYLWSETTGDRDFSIDRETEFPPLQISRGWPCNERQWRSRSPVVENDWLSVARDPCALWDWPDSRLLLATGAYAVGSSAQCSSGRVAILAGVMDGSLCFAFGLVYSPNMDKRLFTMKWSTADRFGSRTRKFPRMRKKNGISVETESGPFVHTHRGIGACGQPASPLSSTSPIRHTAVDHCLQALDYDPGAFTVVVCVQVVQAPQPYGHW